jgi:hypothetical protein
VSLILEPDVAAAAAAHPNPGQAVAQLLVTEHHARVH